MKIAAVSDLHGLRTRFVLLGRLFDEGIDTLLIAGDIAAPGDPSTQQASIRQTFGNLLKDRPNVRIFAIPGNDDWAIVERTLKEFPEVVVPTDRAYPLDAGLLILGYPYVPLTPFLMKDFEKWDRPEEPGLTEGHKHRTLSLVQRGINIFGKRSDGTTLRDFAFDPADRSDNIAADLGRLADVSPPQDTVYLVHTPPAGLFDEGIPFPEPRHFGSRAVLEFIRRNGPRLTIHGHIHEAVEMAGGRFRLTEGPSTVLSVGPGSDPAILYALALDLRTWSFERMRLSRS